MSSLYDITCQRITGENESLANYQQKVLLIVNTASQCGFTPQYQGLEALFQQYTSQGFAVLGFPCNQFGSQDPGSEEDIQHFCQTNYGISFPMFAKIEVNGPNAHPLYQHLKNQAPGLMGSEAIKWNFTKFLVDQSGTVQDRFAPTTKPVDIGPHIQKLLNTNA